MAVIDHLETGRAALRAGRWEEAVAAFERVLHGGEATPEVLDGMGEALWWLCEAPASVRYRERAYVGYRQAGDVARACMTAVNLSICHLVNLGNPVAARGWLARAERVMDVDPNPMQGWLWLMRGFLAGDAEESDRFLTRALEFARDSGDLDLELVALGDLGLALVRAGRVEEGLGLLDEAMAGTLGGEYSRFETVVFTSCNMLAACSLAGDLERATEWCRAADEFMREIGCPFLFASCRTHYGGVLMAKGHWERAEGELHTALGMAEDSGPGLRVEATVRLADLRFRQGRLEEAEALLGAFDDVAVAALPAAAIRLARGEPSVATVILDRHLRRLGHLHIETVPTLALLVDAHLAAGDLEAAAEAASRLDGAVGEQGRPHGAALAALVSAHLATARGMTDEALILLESAWDRFSRLDLPLESSRVRLELAQALASSQPEMAVAEAKGALEVFDRLGAGADADAASSLLRSMGVTGRTGPKKVDALTSREQEVLRLVAAGLSNPEIGERLFISRKTAAHHVSNVLAKLGLRNRAEVVAYAVRTLDRPVR